jgi:predicted transcriptional regulator
MSNSRVAQQSSMVHHGCTDPPVAIQSLFCRLNHWYDRGQTRHMKTAISLPDDLFEAADELAERLGVSRSQHYARALSDFVANHGERNVTERLDAVYGRAEARIDPILQELQFHSVGTGERLVATPRRGLVG